MPYGYHGKILRVNLDTEAIEIEQPGEPFYRRYMGGSALGLYYLLRNTPQGIDPFDPQNTLVLSLSVLTGAPISGLSRMTATAKSPLTEAAGDSQCGGFFPAEMKFAGYDAVVIQGRAERPTYLWINEGEAELRPAEHLCGKATGEVEAILQEELGDEKIEVIQCGLAGEKRCRFAALINMSNRANGRTGMGAVMGSKNIKAVVVRGKDKPTIADRKKLIELARWGSANLEESDAYSLSILGTAGYIGYQDAVGGLPTNNWDSGTFENWKSLDGKTLAKTILKERDTCYACVVRCKPVVEVSEGPYIVQPHYGGPEYETIATFGTNCGVDDLEAIAYANQLCNLFGMDTISCGATIAWAIDSYERGLIDKEDTGGLELRYGNARVVVQLTEMIANREGFGDLLAEGSARAAKKIGRGTEDLVVAVKKQELPAHMPQLKRSLALIYAVNPFGADHMSSEHDLSYGQYPERMAELGLLDPQPERILNVEKVRFALKTQYLYSCMDTLNVCQFVYGPSGQLYKPSQLTEVVRAITGWDVSLEELVKVGERRLNLLRAYNAREGIGREADILPKKLSKALVGGKSGGLFVTAEEVEQAKDWYYTMAGWDLTTGTPTREKLEELDLAWVADELSL